VRKNSITALSSKDGELVTSTTTSAPDKAPSRPSPVKLFTPVDGAAAKTSCPPALSFAPSLRPMRPVPPMITTFMLKLQGGKGRAR
jgi:hypothetical protein